MRGVQRSVGRVTVQRLTWLLLFVFFGIKFTAAQQPVEAVEQEHQSIPIHEDILQAAHSDDAGNHGYNHEKAAAAPPPQPIPIDQYEAPYNGDGHAAQIVPPQPIEPRQYEHAPPYYQQQQHAAAAAASGGGGGIVGFDKVPPQPPQPVPVAPAPVFVGEHVAADVVGADAVVQQQSAYAAAVDVVNQEGAHENLAAEPYGYEHAQQIPAGVAGDPEYAQLIHPPQGIEPVEHQHQIGPVALEDVPDEQYNELMRVNHIMHDPLAQHRHVDQDDGQTHDEEDNFVDEWADHMDDFIPDMLVTLKLPSKGEEFFYQEVGPESVLIRGGYFVGGDGGDVPVRFDVIDPDGEIVMKRLRSESLFHFSTEKKGIYSFMLQNPNWTGTKFVTMVLGAGNETMLSSEQLRSVSDNIVALGRMARDIQNESTYLWGRQRTYMHSLTKMRSRVLWLSCLELLTIVGVVGIQVYLMKSLVSNKRFF